ncbi:MAG: trigger factor [Chlamydiota bacterium]
METENQPKELANDLIRCTVLQKPDCVVEFSVTASKKLVDESKEIAAKSVNKHVTVPGFRRGKAPESLIFKNFSKEIDKSAREILARRAYVECQLLTSLINLDAKESFSCHINSFSEEEAKLTLSFETNPVVPTVNSSECVLKPINRPEVNESKIQETIRQALFFHASWDTITGRSVQEGDFIILDADILEDNASPHPLFKGTRFEVTDKSMARWMKDAVLGKNAGDSTEATSVADEDASEEEKALFKPSQVKLTIQTIEQATLPELTEDLLRKMGASSEQDLKDKIEKQLNEQADDYVSENLREQAIDFLIKTYPFDIPKSFVRKELEFRTSQLSQDRSFMDHWKSLTEAEKQKMIGFLTSQTEKSILLSLLCSALLNQNSIPFPNTKTTSAGSFGEYSQKILLSATDYIIEQSKQKALTC